MKPGIDIAMTAALRPEIILQTLNSFQQGLLDFPPHRLFVNIDPVGDRQYSQADVAAAISEAFDGECHFNTPKRPSFPSALKWAWEQVETEYFLNLEDDWMLGGSFSIKEMTAVMQQFPALATLRFPKGGATETECVQSNSSKEPRYLFNGAYYQCPANRNTKANYYGSPSLIRTAWAKQFTLEITGAGSPECQFRKWKKKGDKRILAWDYGVWSKPGVKAGVIDIGTVWRHRNKIAKNSYSKFTKWSSNEA